MPDKLNDLYKQLSKSKKINGLPDYKIFAETMADPKKAEEFYKMLKENQAVQGLPDNYNDFALGLGLQPTMMPEMPKMASESTDVDIPVISMEGMEKFHEQKKKEKDQAYSAGYNKDALVKPPRSFGKFDLDQERAFIEGREDFVAEQANSKYGLQAAIKDKKSLSPDLDDSQAREIVLNDDAKYVVENVYNKKRQEAYKFKARTSTMYEELEAIDNQLKTNPGNNQLIEQKRKLKADIKLREEQYKELMGDGYRALYDERGQFLDQQWTEQDNKDVEAQFREYQDWDISSLADLYHEQLARFKYLQDQRDQLIYGEPASGIQMAARTGFNIAGKVTPPDEVTTPVTNIKELKNLNPLVRSQYKTLLAVSDAFMLNKDFGAIKRTKGKAFLRGLLGEIYTPDVQLAEKYAEAANEFGGKLTEEQKKATEPIKGEAMAQMLGTTTNAMGQLAVTTLLTKGAGSIAGITNTVNKMRGLILAKKGKTAAKVFDLSLTMAEGALRYGITPSDDITAAMGTGEEAAQFLMSALFKGKSMNKLLRPLVRGMVGGSSETVAEYVGNMAQALAQNGFNLEDATNRAFGETKEERIEMLRQTMVLCFGLSMGGQISKATADGIFKDGLKQLPLQDQKVVQEMMDNTPDTNKGIDSDPGVKGVKPLTYRQYMEFEENDRVLKSIVAADEVLADIEKKRKILKDTGGPVDIEASTDQAVVGVLGTKPTGISTEEELDKLRDKAQEHKDIGDDILQKRKDKPTEERDAPYQLGYKDYQTKEELFEDLRRLDATPGRGGKMPETMHMPTIKAIDEFYELERQAQRKRTGEQFHEYFTNVAKGVKGKSTVQYQPVLKLDPKQLKLAESIEKHKGEFSEHIARSIPGHREIQAATATAVTESYDKAEVLDIGGSDNAWSKAITENKESIKTTTVDPNTEMKQHSEKTPVEGNRYIAKPFMTGWENNSAWEPDQKYDVVHESMTFQFVSNERKAQIDYIADKVLKDDGVFMSEEKFIPEDMNQAKDPESSWSMAETQKDNFKRQYFPEEELTQKKKEVLEGMEERMVSQEAYESMLLEKFDHVYRYWDSGNFKGYLASNNIEAIKKMANSIGKTGEGEFSVEPIGTVTKAGAAGPISEAKKSLEGKPSSRTRNKAIRDIAETIITSENLTGEELVKEVKDELAAYEIEDETIKTQVARAEQKTNVKGLIDHIRNTLEAIKNIPEMDRAEYAKQFKREAKEDLKTVNKVEALKQFLDSEKERLSMLMGNEIYRLGKLSAQSTVSDAQFVDAIDKILGNLDRAEERFTKKTRKSLESKARKALRDNKTATTLAKVNRWMKMDEGQIEAEHQAIATDIGNTRAEMIQKAAELETIEEKEALEGEYAQELEAMEADISLLNVFSNLDGKDLSELKDAHAILDQVITDTRTQTAEAKAATDKVVDDLAEGAAKDTQGKLTEEEIVGSEDIAAKNTENASVLSKVWTRFKSFQQAQEYLFKALDKSFEAGSKAYNWTKSNYYKLSKMWREGAEKLHEARNILKTDFEQGLVDIFGTIGKAKKAATQKVEITLGYMEEVDGEKVQKKAKVEVTLGQAGHLWMSHQLEENRGYTKRITGVHPGITYSLEAMDEAGEPTTELFDQLDQQLRENHPEIIEYMEWLVDEMLPKAKPFIEPIYKELTGHDLLTYSSYLFVNAKSTSVEADSLTDDSFLTIFQSMVKERKGGKYDLTRNDGIFGMYEYIDNTSRFYGLAKPFHIINRVLSHRDVKGMVGKRGLNPYVAAIRKLMITHMDGDKDWNRGVGGWVSRYVGSKILLNGYLAVKQQASMLTALDPKYAPTGKVIESAVRLMKASNRKAAWDIMKKAYGLKERHIIRIEGSLKEAQMSGWKRTKLDNFKDTLDSIADSIMGKDPVARRRWREFMYNWLMPTKYGDKIAIKNAGLPLIDAAYRQRMEELADTGMDQQTMEEIAAKHAKDTFLHWMNQTQQSAEMTDKRLWQTGLRKVMVPFMNTNMLYTDRIFDAYTDLYRNTVARKKYLMDNNPGMSSAAATLRAAFGNKDNKKALGQIMLYQVVLPNLWDALTTFGFSIRDLWSDDEELKKKAFNRLGTNVALGSWMKGIPVVAQFYGVYEAKRDYDMALPREIPMLAMYTDLWKVFYYGDRMFDYKGKIKGMSSKEADEIRDTYKNMQEELTWSAMNTLGLPGLFASRVNEVIDEDEYEQEFMKRMLRLTGVPKTTIKRVTEEEY